MLTKIAKKQFTQKFKKSWYEGYQGQTWKHILEHDHFSSELISFDWILTDSERAGKSDQDISDLSEDMTYKIFDIFIERSSALFSEDECLMWLREIIGFTLNKMDAGEISDADLLVA